MPLSSPPVVSLFFLNNPPTTETYTLSLHDALPILPQATLSDFRRSPAHRWNKGASPPAICLEFPLSTCPTYGWRRGDRKSTRLNSSHANISYAVFCLKKKNKKNHE